MKNKLNHPALFFCLGLALLLSSTCRGGPDPAYGEAAEEAARWIRSTSLESTGGIWPAVPGDEKTVGTTLYSGVPGIVLFFLELYSATEDPSYLQDAMKGADFLLSRLDDEQVFGLYVGISGIGYVLQETFKASSMQSTMNG